MERSTTTKKHLISPKDQEDDVPKRVEDLEESQSFLLKDWQSETHVSEVQELIKAHETIKHIEKMTQSIGQVFQECKGDRDNSLCLTVEKLEWETLHDVATLIMQDYTIKIDQIMVKLNDLNRRIMLWQEAAFIMDSHRGIGQVRECEDWITLKEIYLDYKHKVLNDSINEIKNTVARLPNN